MFVMRLPRSWFLCLFLGLNVAAFAGCAPQAGQALPDDPESEPVKSPEASAKNPNVPKFDSPSSVSTEQQAILDKYPNLDPNHLVPTNLLKDAVLYYDANLSKIPNKNYLSVVDFAKPSNLHRFFIIDMKTGEVWDIPVAHGKGSDANNDGMADKFSNVEGSEASSLGFYLTAETYSGTHGLSLRLDGLSKTNSNVRSRDVVLHGADYVQDRNVKQGRSWGCLAIPMNYRDKLVGYLKGGALIYAERGI